LHVHWILYLKSHPLDVSSDTAHPYECDDTLLRTLNSQTEAIAKQFSNHSDVILDFHFVRVHAQFVQGSLRSHWKYKIYSHGEQKTRFFRVEDLRDSYPQFFQFLDPMRGHGTQTAMPYTMGKMYMMALYYRKASAFLKLDIDKFVLIHGDDFFRAISHRAVSVTLTSAQANGLIENAPHWGKQQPQSIDLKWHSSGKLQIVRAHVAKYSGVGEGTRFYFMNMHRNHEHEADTFYCDDTLGDIRNWLEESPNKPINLTLKLSLGDRVGTALEILPGLLA
jgi:hypothetical protein